jgi:putative serine protease PepD
LVVALVSGAVAAGVTLGILKSQSRTNSQELNLGSRVSLTEDSATLQVAGRALPAVVSVVTDEAGQGYGSGFLLTTDGYLVTSIGVVADSAMLSVLLPGDGRRRDARMVDYDCETGIAVLKVDQVSGLPTLTFGDSSQLKVGQAVIALGGPYGAQTVAASRGIVGSLHRTTALSPSLVGAPAGYPDTILTDAATAAGDSGGPLLNVAGQVVGVTLPPGSGQVTTVAISSNDIQTEIEQIVQSGQVVVATLGALVRDLSPEDAAIRTLVAGGLVTSVQPGSPAEAAGLKPGDIITQLDDNKVDAAHPLAQVLRAHYRPSQRAAVSYNRGAGSSQVQVTLGGAHPAC